MKKHKILITMMASIAISGAGVFSTASYNTNVVEAKARFSSKYWLKNHKIIATKNVTAYEVKGKRNKIIKKRRIKKGKHLTARRKASVWYLSKYAKAKHSAYWIIKNENTNWFKLDNHKKAKKRVVKKVNASKTTQTAKQVKPSEWWANLPNIDFDTNQPLAAQINQALQLQGNERKAAEFKIMQEEGLVRNDRPLVSLQSFESQITHMSNDLNSMTRSILG